MKHCAYLFTLFTSLLLSACVNEFNPTRKAGDGTLVLSNLSREDAREAFVSTRSVEEGLAVEILDADGTPHEGMSYAAGATIPSKLILSAGNYSLRAYSENQDSWRNDNGGLGSALYDITQPFTIQADWITYLDVRVPMRNYAVTYSVPDNFSFWFPTAEFTVSADGLTLHPQLSQTAYFDPDSGSGFTFQLHLVNSDGEEYTTEQHTFDLPEAGHLYDVHYSFVSEDDPSRLRVTITYDDGYEEGSSTEIIID